MSNVGGVPPEHLFLWVPDHYLGTPGPQVIATAPILPTLPDGAVPDEAYKRKKDAENELLSLRDLESRIKQFDNTSRATLGEKQRRMRDNILQEIRDTVKAHVKKSGHTLVIDTAAENGGKA